jgi:hypothetical protein
MWRSHCTDRAIPEPSYWASFHYSQCIFVNSDVPSIAIFVNKLTCCYVPVCCDKRLALHLFKLSVDGLSLWRPLFNHRQVQVRFMVEKLALRQVCSECLFCPIPLVLYTHSFFCHWCRIILAVNSTISNTSVRNRTKEVIRYVAVMLFLLVASEHSVRKMKSQCCFTCLTLEEAADVSMKPMVILSLDMVVRNFVQSQCCQWMFRQHCGSSYIARVPLRTDEVTVCC